MKPETRGAQ